MGSVNAAGAPPGRTAKRLPCVAFNNHAGSTRSYDWVREHNDAVNRFDPGSSPGQAVMPPRAEIVLLYTKGVTG